MSPTVGHRAARRSAASATSPGSHRRRRPLPEAAAFGDGVAVRLPDGSTAMAPNAVAASAVRHALTQLGVPYDWGGTTPGVGLDCSGLTQWAYHEAGLKLPRLAQEQDVGAAVDRRVAAPGRPRGVGRPRRDDRRQRHDDRGGRPGEAVADPNDQRGSGFSGVLATDRRERPASWHGVSPMHMPLITKRCRHRFDSAAPNPDRRLPHHGSATAGHAAATPRYRVPPNENQRADLPSDRWRPQLLRDRPRGGALEASRPTLLRPRRHYRRCRVLNTSSVMVRNCCTAVSERGFLARGVHVEVGTAFNA